MRKQINIGLFGFGCVGNGLYDVLSNSPGFKADIKKIVVKNKHKKRSLPPEKFLYHKSEILDDPDINLVVELIDNATDAFEIVKEALQKGKNVVTANKKMIAENFSELVELQQKYGCSLLYEASSCGSIPILRTLEEYYDNELLNSVSGIFNGSSNYILTKIQNENISYETALKQAQELGFAESNPKLDVEGYDAKYKLIIVAGHSFGVFIKPEQVLNLGIQNLQKQDVEYAKQNHKKIRLIAGVYKTDKKHITLFVAPRFVDKNDPLYHVDNEYNAVTVEAAFSDKQLFIGKGAGGHPTGSAVLSDISANAYDYKYEYKKRFQSHQVEYTNDIEPEIYIRYNHKNILDKLEISSVSSFGTNYILAYISLKELLNKKELINQSGSLVVFTGNFKTPYIKQPSLLHVSLTNSE
jgi:homoserine dehydrogenase